MRFSDVKKGDRVMLDISLGPPDNTYGWGEWSKIEDAVVICKMASWCGLIHEAVGVDFGVELEGLHDLGGRLESGSGHWIPARFLLRSKELEWD